MCVLLFFFFSPFFFFCNRSPLRYSNSRKLNYVFNPPRNTFTLFVPMFAFTSRREVKTLKVSCLDPLNTLMLSVLVSTPLVNLYKLLPTCDWLYHLYHRILRPLLRFQHHTYHTCVWLVPVVFQTYCRDAAATQTRRYARRGRGWPEGQTQKYRQRERYKLSER